MLNKVLDTDEGASRLGRSGAGAAFLADLGLAACCSTTRCLTKMPPATSRSASAIRNASSMAPISPRRRSRAKGGNSSLIHIDWMIGSGQVDIDGIQADGARVPVMRKGEWA